jgi:hypothetical protein
MVAVMVMIVWQYNLLPPLIDVMVMIDKTKVATKQQNLSKIKLKIKQYNMDV